MIYFFAIALGLAHSTTLSWFRTQTTQLQGPVRAIWIVQTEFRGEANARLAVAKKFDGAEIEVLSLEQISNRPDTPDLLIHSFAQPAEESILWNLKSRSNRKMFFAHLGPSRFQNKSFDLIAALEGDPVDPSRVYWRLESIPSGVNLVSLNKAEAEWQATFSGLPGPVTNLILGGQLPGRELTTRHGEALGTRLTSILRSMGGSLLLTTSRRTNDSFLRGLLDTIHGLPIYFHRWSDDATNKNPYLAMLAVADFIVVTGDSLSIISDAIETEKPVYVYAPTTSVEPLQQRFILSQYKAGRIRPFADKLESWSYEAPRSASKIASEIQRQRGCASLLSLSGLNKR